MPDVRRGLDEMKIRAGPCLKHPGLVQLAREFLPTKAGKLALIKTKNEELAKACRWLAVIRRDFGDEKFEEIVSSARSRKS